MAKISKEKTEKIKNDLRSYMMKKGYNIQSLADLLSKTYDRPESAQNLSNKLNRGAIKYAEVLEIAEVLGYDIKWIDNG